MKPDRSLLFPSHQGYNVLPNSPFFTKLLRHAYRQRLAIVDHHLGVEKTYAHVLSDALALGAALEQRLHPKILKQLRTGDEHFIGILAAGGYEYTVAMVAGLALGAAVVPMSVANPPEEVLYFVEKSKQIAVLSSASASSLAKAAIEMTQWTTAPTHLDIMETIKDAPVTPSSQIVISSNPYLDDNAAGVVIFTSGTTGKPKGSVLRRAYIHEAALNVVDGYDITHTDRILHTLPVHHATGIGTSFFPFLVSGACIEFRTHGSFDPSWVWHRLREGGITIFSGVPTMYLRLLWHWQKEIARLSREDQDAFANGVRALRCLLCGSSALQQQVQDFFTSLRDNDRPGILVRYGSSEIPGCIRVDMNTDFTKLPKGCVGTPTPGVDIKVDGEGELLLRSPLMFASYLHDSAATTSAHDQDGWFKTGDICRLDGRFVFIVGRASVDIIKSGGYKIGALEVERACSDLPYIKEVSVVGVEDEEFGQRVAAVVSLSTKLDLTIATLRNDLRGGLPSYKLPTLLRIYPGELPKGQTGKIQKKDVAKTMAQWRMNDDIQVWQRHNPPSRSKI